VKTPATALLALVEEWLDTPRGGARGGTRSISNIVRSACPADRGGINELLGARAQARSSKIAAYLDEQVAGEVTGDAARLRPVLLNLAGNAIITLTGGSVADRRARHLAQRNQLFFGARLRLYGIDTRSPAADFPRVRAGRRENRPQYGGTGLGLSISERIGQADGRPHHVESSLASARLRGSIPLATSDGQRTGVFAHQISMAKVHQAG